MAKYRSLNALLTVGESSDNVRTWCVVSMNGKRKHRICPWKCDVPATFLLIDRSKRIDVSVQFVARDGSVKFFFGGVSTLESSELMQSVTPSSSVQLYTSFFITKPNGASKEHHLKVSSNESPRNAALRFVQEHMTTEARSTQLKWVEELEKNLLSSLARNEARKIKIKITSKACTHLVIGASESEVANPADHGYSSNWLLLTSNDLDILEPEQWRQYFRKNSIHVIISEHVFEHLTWSQAQDATSLCLEYLRPGGVLRLAVPDAYHNDNLGSSELKARRAEDIEWDHRIQFNHVSLTILLTSMSFKEVVLLEWHTRRGFSYTRRWSPLQGFVQRTKYFDPRGPVSLLVDAVKDDAGGPLGSRFRGTHHYDLESRHHHQVTRGAVDELVNEAKKQHLGADVDNRQLSETGALLDRALLLNPFDVEALKFVGEVTGESGIIQMAELRRKIRNL